MGVMGICVYCGDIHGSEMDHILPWKRGGVDIEENLRISCSICNKRKLDITPEEWKLYVGKAFREGVSGEFLEGWPKVPHPPKAPISKRGLLYINNARRFNGLNPLETRLAKGVDLVFRYKNGGTMKMGFVGSFAKARLHLAALITSYYIGEPIGFELSPAEIEVPRKTPWGDV